MGVMEERGRLKGRMKLFGEGGNPNALWVFGREKSFISLLRIIPDSSCDKHILSFSNK